MYSKNMNEPYKKDDDDFYCTVGHLRRVIADLPDDAKVYYERIEDVYFERHGWTPDLLVPDDSKHIYPDIPDNQYIRVFCAYKYDNRLCLTAHY